MFEPLADPDFFAQVRVDDALGTVVWPNGADLDPLVLHGDFEPAAQVSRVRRHAGIANGIYRDGDLDRLRDEWAY